MLYSTLIRFFAIDFTKILFAKFATGPLGFFGRVEDKDDRFKKKELFAVSRNTTFCFRVYHSFLNIQNFCVQRWSHESNYCTATCLKLLFKHGKCFYRFKFLFYRFFIGVLTHFSIITILGLELWLLLMQGSTRHGSQSSSAHLP